MATAKTATLSIRIDPGLKEALRAVADHEHRSIANMIEVMILEYCGETGIAVSNKSIEGQSAKKKAK